MINPTPYITPINKAICNKMFPINILFLYAREQGEKNFSPYFRLFFVIFSLYAIGWSPVITSLLAIMFEP